MQSIKGILIFLLSCTAIAIGCQPDKTPHRITGVWDLEYLYIGDVDCTGVVKNNPCYSPYRIEYCNVECQITVKEQRDTCQFQAGYTFPQGDYNRLCINAQGNIGSVGPWIAQYPGVCWEIEKLNKKQLWLNCWYQNKYCWVHLKKL
ncbi:MAG: hypothetical protein RIQ89_267 [Bacteroidota bacterium]